jgi:cell wall-associated NlpC family hydrolase
LRTHDKARSHTKLTTAVVLAAAALAMLPATLARAGDGGTGTSSSQARPGKAKLVNGKAIPPSNAPARVVRVIDAANRIRKKPYKYGGGHGRWNDRGYDCSGAVSYALHGGRLLKRPLDSSGFMRWARRGKGKWITVYSNPGHAYMTVAGLRFDTSMTRGDGPGWSKRMRSSSGYRKRHKGRF